MFMLCSALLQMMLRAVGDGFAVVAGGWTGRAQRNAAQAALAISTQRRAQEEAAALLAPHADAEPFNVQPERRDDMKLLCVALPADSEHTADDFVPLRADGHHREVDALHGGVPVGCMLGTSP